MRREDAEKLLGGWAAGTLTDAERRTLLEAAIEDQALFEQLAAEQPLKETLEDPALRQRIHAAATAEPPRRLWIWGLAGSAVAASVLTVALVRWDRPAPAQIAQVRETAAPARKLEMPAPRREKARAIPPPPATAPTLDLAQLPPPPAADIPAAPPAPERRLAGGVAGGVVGGIMPAPPRVMHETAVRPEAKALRATALLPQTPLHYRILRRSETGEYIPAEQPLRPNDSLRLSVRVEQRTELRIATPNAVLWSGTAYPNQETAVFIPPKTTRIILTASGPPTTIDLNYE